MPLDLKEWVDLAFGGQIVSGLDGRKPISLDEVCGPNENTIRLLTEVFENATFFLQPYPDEILNRSFWDLSSSALHSLRNEGIEWALRQRLIGSFENLFREFFAIRCRPVLGHRNEEGSPLNSACYMWWDFDCWVATSDPLTRNRMDSAFLASMRSILEIDHIACQESALHGLGHWHWAHSAAVERIVDEFLERTPKVPDRLREYASSARCGCVQ